MVHLTHSLVDEGVHNFPQDISPNVNAIALLEFELSHFVVVVQFVNQ